MDQSLRATLNMKGPENANASVAPEVTRLQSSRRSNVQQMLDSEQSRDGVTRTDTKSTSVEYSDQCSYVHRYTLSRALSTLQL